MELNNKRSAEIDAIGKASAEHLARILKDNAEFATRGYIKPLLNVSEFAELVGVSPKTVYGWLKKGHIKKNRAGFITSAEARRFIS